MKRRGLRVTWCLAALAVTGCAPRAPAGGEPVLLFNGVGTSPNDVVAVEAVLKESGLGYRTVDSRRLNEMSETELRGHRLLIIPGGNFLEMGRGLTPGATSNIRKAVRGGLSYLGICAGGLLAGDGPENSLNLTSGVRFGFYAIVNQGVHKAAVPITVDGGPTLEQYWEDGPQFTGWGAVVGRYPDGTPAIVEGACGEGWVVLCGFHPEAPESWRRGMTFGTAVSDANAYARTLVDAARRRTSLRHELRPDRGTD